MKENKIVRKHAERRIKFTDTFIRKLRPLDRPYSYGDSEVPGLRIYVEVSGTKTFLKLVNNYAKLIFLK
tara:strand:- start:142 stop:348 length:207 start_codon:yes stop_codon:yes gene_type:complete